MIRQQLPGNKLNGLDKRLSVFFGILVLIGLVTIGFLSTLPRDLEKYTQFYILGIQGQAADYPSSFTLENGRVISVKYGTESSQVTEDQQGRLTLGIVNNEKAETNYQIAMQISGLPANILAGGESISSLGPLTLAADGKWEQEIGIVPLLIGDNQKVELLLYKGNCTEPYLSLCLFINVK